MPKGLLFVTEINGDVLKDAKWFTNDVPVVKTGVFIIPIALTSKVKVECTVDGGTIWMGLAEAQPSKIIYRGIVLVSTGDSFNLRAVNTTTITSCRIFFSEIGS